MKKLFAVFILFSICANVQAQKKKNKGKDNTNFQVDSLASNDSLRTADSIPPPPVSKSSKKGKESSKSSKSTNFNSNDSTQVKSTTKKGKTSDKKDDKKGKKEASVNFKDPTSEPTPVADTSKRFIGVIKYRMTSDDPSQKDSMFIIFGENQIRVKMFTPGYREGQIFEDNLIANFSDSTFTELDVRNMTYKTEKLGTRNTGFEFSLANNKKTGQVMNIVCEEYKGEMVTPDEDVFEAACLLSKNYQYMSAMDYNFMNIQPVVIGYKIVLGFRTKTPDNESTYIIAYKIEPGNTSTYFDLSPYKAK